MSHKAIAYTRVSSKEQCEGYSLDHQEDEIKKFAEKSDIEIVKVFVEKGKSAKNADRIEFKNMMSYCRKNCNEINYVIVFDLQRLSRNMSVYLRIIEDLSSLEIDILSVNENNDKTSSGKFLRNMLSVVNEYDNDIRKDKSTAGMLQALREGRWIFGTPFGYSYTQSSGNKKVIIPNEHGNTITELFEKASSGTYSTCELIEEFKYRIPSLNYNKLRKIITNEFYIGYINSKMIPERVKGKHEPLTSEATFLRAQNLYNHKKKNTVDYSCDFPLNGFATHNGERLCGCWAKGKKKKYAHYRTHKQKFNISAINAEQYFKDILRQYTFTKEIIDILFSMIETSIDKQNRSNLSTLETLEKEKKAIAIKKSKLIDLFTEDKLDIDSYNLKINEFKTREKEIAIEMESYEPKSMDYLKYRDLLTEKLCNLADSWEKMSNTDKQLFQRILFPSGIEIEKSECRTLAKSLILKALDDIKLPENSSGVPNSHFRQVYSNSLSVYTSRLNLLHYPNLHHKLPYAQKSQKRVTLLKN